jgi:predicted DsbA family dithiol-disulfide isomerase
MLRQAFVSDPTALERTMTTKLKIDFVSDISCPWCAIGLSALEQALGKLQRGRRAAPALRANRRFGRYSRVPDAEVRLHA